ncbi:MAG: phosphoglycerate mutase, partial [bacterium (Candidatus Ratteibacteria) CG_4_10_14_3_um_filter_41_18]
NKELCALLQKKISALEEVKLSFKAVKEHRCVVLLKGKDLVEGISDTDPQKEGEKTKEAIPLIKEAKKTASLVNKLTKRINEVLKGEASANTVLLRGISKIPHLPSFQEKYLLRSACIATYPMYRGLAKLVGMEILPTGETIKDEIETLKENFQNYDFFYLHIKKGDSYGEDGNFEKKVFVIEEVDTFIPEIEQLHPDVLVITGDHSTPSLLKGHSWHPNPFLLLSKNCLPDNLSNFSERSCCQGSLGKFPATQAMVLMLANSLRLKKFGA